MFEIRKAAVLACLIGILSAVVPIEGWHGLPGWLTSRWGNAVPAEEGGPRRRYYQLTKDGAERALIALGQATASTAHLHLAPRPAGGAI